MARFPSQVFESVCSGPPDSAWLRAASVEELLAHLLMLGREVTDPVAAARATIQVSDGLSSLAVSSSPDVRRLQTAVRIARELTRRAAVDRAERRQMQRAEDLAFVADAELSGADRERLLLLVCDAGNRLMHATVVTEGTTDRLLIPVRETVALVLQQGGRAFALAHNHPSGDTTPSPADIEGTRSLAAAAGTVGLRFLGHVVVAEGRWQTVESGEVCEGRVDG